MSKKFVPDDRWESQPDFPTDRPPTRAEVWEYVQHYYHDLKSEREMKAYAAQCWAGNYVYWVNFHGWDKQPDWKPGDPVIPAGVPGRGDIKSGDNAYQIVKTYYDAARSAA